MLVSEQRAAAQPILLVVGSSRPPLSELVKRGTFLYSLSRVTQAAPSAGTGRRRGAQTNCSRAAVLQPVAGIEQERWTISGSDRISRPLNDGGGTDRCRHSPSPAACRARLTSMRTTAVWATARRARRGAERRHRGDRPAQSGVDRQDRAMRGNNYCSVDPRACRPARRRRPVSAIAQPASTKVARAGRLRAGAQAAHLVDRQHLHHFAADGRGGHVQGLIVFPRPFPAGRSDRPRDRRFIRKATCPVHAVTGVFRCCVPCSVCSIEPVAAKRPRSHSASSGA